MKNLKIVFASLLLAVMGVVGFSSFTTAPKKAVAQVQYAFTVSGWEADTPPANCTEVEEYCGFTFDDENGLDAEVDVIPHLPSIEDIKNAPGGVIMYGETPVTFYLRAADNK